MNPNGIELILEVGSLLPHGECESMLPRFFSLWIVAKKWSYLNIVLHIELCVT